MSRTLQPYLPSARRGPDPLSLHVAPRRVQNEERCVVLHKAAPDNGVGELAMGLVDVVCALPDANVLECEKMVQIVIGN